MSGRARGFTLIELMIVIAIIAIIAAIAIPNLIEARKSANESSAIASLRAIHAAQNLFKDRDYDKDGYHYFAGELPRLAGLIDARLAGPVAGGPFTGGTGQRSGYWFGMVSGGASEVWSCIAVPVSFGRSGDRNFFIDETGVIRYDTSDLIPGGVVPATPPNFQLWPALGASGGSTGSTTGPSAVN
jgi:type IV pilus assembly protein PilA